ncbi:ArsR/SmtB family transcription factor [Inquilinus limosus]|uniref:ArsR/SmtB family transcription factor n=1 Tax=Inquilinus limosus TaxID=171674 RepID=UPI00041FB0BF|nr:metalloregulator ArsR/SmtB family transcription factor [Inquilinus limosus]
MKEGLDLASLSSLIGDPSRALILSALFGGEALPAGELAWRARVTPQTASSHLTKLTEAGLVTVRRLGRHRYYALAGAEIGALLETMLTLASPPPAAASRSKVPAPLREGRMCYDHLAGRLGVAITNALMAQGVLRADDHGFALSEAAPGWLAALDIDVDRLRQGRRAVTRRCQDWSERRPHLSGALGAAIADRFLEQGWIRRDRDSRAVALTDSGRGALARIFGPGILAEAAQSPD